MIPALRQTMFLSRDSLHYVDVFRITVKEEKPVIPDLVS